jgi:hypothetical protein
MLRGIFGPTSKRDEVTGGWIKFFMRSFIICRVKSGMIKSRRMRWAGHSARTKEMIN